MNRLAAVPLCLLVALVGCGEDAAVSETSPSFESDPPATALEGEAYTYVVEVSGNPEPAVSASGPNGEPLSDWLSFDSAGPTLSGTPQSDDVGDHEVVLTASSGIDPDAVQAFTISVIADGTAPTITSTPITVATEGELYSYAVTAVGNPEPTLQAAGSEGQALPGWMSFDEETGELFGHPTEEEIGEHAVELTAMNGVEPAAVQAFVITVERAEEAPAFTSTPVTTATVGEHYEYALTASGHPEPSFSVSLAGGDGLPGWLTFEEPSATLTGLPGEEDVGEVALVVTAVNGIAPHAAQSFTIEVQPAPEAPAIISEPPVGVEAGQEYVYEVIATGYPAASISASGPDEDPLPVWLSFDEGTAKLFGVPGDDDVGEHAVVVTALNEVDEDSQDVVISVTPAPEAPVITSAPLTVATVDEAYTYAVTATGHPAPTFTATVGSDPLPDWLEIDSTSGLLSGTPGPGDTGVLSMVVTAANGVPPVALQTFQLTVNPPDEAPVMTSTPVVEVTAGESYEYGVSATGFPEPTFTATGAGGGALPGWLSFDAAGAILSGAPLDGDVGGHDVVITATNGVDPDATQSFTIEVLRAPEAPAITSTPATEVTEGEAYSYVVTATGHPDPTLSAAQQGGGALPAWLSFSAGSGELVGTPGAGDVGTVDLVITATNGVSPDATQSFTIEVLQAPEAPVITSTPVTEVTEGEAYSYVVTATGHPEPTLSAAQQGGGALPAWLSFSPNTGDLFGTPGAGDVGTVDLVITATNGVSPDATQSFTIEVLRAPEAPAITSTPVTEVTEGEAYSYVVTATGHPEPTLSAAQQGGGALPAWLSFSPNTGDLFGTPGEGDVGTVDLVITATNGVSPDATQSFTIEVLQAPEAPAITSSPVTAVMEGEVYSYIVTATGHPEPTLSAAQQGGGALPAWLSFTAASGELSGTPRAEDVGTVDIVITATNGVSPDATQSFTIEVLQATAAPIITSAPPATGSVDEPWSYTVTASGDPQPLFSVSGEPDWLSFDGVDTLFGTPTAFDVGVSPLITVTASNGIDPDATQQFTIEVEPAASIPLLVAPLFEPFGNALPSGWSARGEWEFGIPTVGPDELHDGELAATVLDGNYSNLTLSSMLSPVLDLTGLTTPTLTFAHWYEIESGMYDGANVKLSTDGGASFFELQAGSVSPAYTGTIRSGFQNPITGEEGWSGETGDWEIVTIDLGPNLVGQPVDQVVVRFDLGSDSTIHRPGWYVDSVFLGQDSSDPGVEIVSYLFDGDVKTPALLAQNLSAGRFDNRDGNAAFAAGNDGGRAILSAGWADPANPNYFEFTVTAADGWQVEPSLLHFDERASATGPSDYQVSVIHDGVEEALAGGGGSTLKQDFPQPSPMVTVPFESNEAGPYEGSVTIRVRGSGATGSTGTWRLDNVRLFGAVTMVDPVAPSITSPPPPETGSIDVEYSHTITVTGNPPPSLAVSGLPAWLFFDGVDTISGTPTALDVGESGTITITASNGVIPDAVQEFTVSVAPPPAIAVADGSPVIEDFEAASEGWTATGDWEIGLHTYGPSTAYDGALAATRLDEDYSPSTRSILQSPIFDLQNVTDPSMRFYHWFHIRAGGYHGGNIKISTDGGITWSELVPDSVTPEYTGTLRTFIPLGGELGWYDVIPGDAWTAVSVDLEANLSGAPRDQVVLRFDFASSAYTMRPGWYVDDVAVGAAVDLPIPPKIITTPPLSVLAGGTYIYEVEAEGMPAPTLSASAAGGAPLPAWLAFDAGAGELVGFPGAADVGVHALEVTATNVGGSDLQSFELTVLPEDAEPVFSDDFEGDPADSLWVMGHEVGTGTDWDIGVPTSGPGSAFVGSQCAGTVLGGAYTSSEARLSYIQTPVLDLSGIFSPAVRFYHWHDIDGSWDGGNVKISTDGGQTFVALVEGTETPPYSGTIATAWGNPMGGQPAWYNLSSGWVQVEIDLAPNLDSLPLDQVVIRLEFGTEDWDKTRPGWYIDDFHVGESITLP